ncbi:phosphonopyruvate decarboxylase [Treponema parvum]|uniref:Phosphonopyruvate decarboxylase n=1 Tax=Treponema parvum TaxID=138851 RepID=A0A975F7C9_9SPIR|nr:phosphonopyruvate decarboxylase [Treponema parvum]QTQ15144.1 phosphonopyruvate decarboxylase [Treponema parvum]
MIRPELFYNELKANGTDFFTGVPDSLLKNFCAYVTDNTQKNNHIIAANEGCATGLAAGYHFATGKIPLIYMQNSGLGNTVNPLLSLMDPEVYSVPVVLVVGWRGEPGVHDEPQHIKQGKVTIPLLEAMKIPYVILTADEGELKSQISECYNYVRSHNAPFAFVVKKNTFDAYKLKNDAPVQAELSREEAIELIMLNCEPGSAFVSTTGMASRELFELREKHGMSHKTDFLTVGSMGHASQIALSIAMQKPNRKIYCLDGDGASLMHMGGMTTIGTIGVKNFTHIVLNNGAHDSVGGQPTVALKIDLCRIAKAAGYEYTASISTPEELKKILLNPEIKNKLSFIEIKVHKGARSNLGRPTSTPEENKKAFMEFLYD